VLNILLLPCMVLAGIGFVLSSAAHVASIVGVQIPGGSAVLALQVGIFAAWLPAVLVMSSFRGRVSNRDLWKVALSGCPGWMRAAVFVVFGYAFLNFFYCFVIMPGRPQSDGSSLLSEVRGISGHWMIFYATAFAVLYSARRRPELFTARRCSAQHEVAPDAEYCERCGERLKARVRGA
jgi:hypothetical protein